MSRAAARTHRGLRERTIESRFIGELPGESVIHSDQGSEWDGGADSEDPFLGGGVSTRGGGSRRLSSLCAAFPSGTLVEHPKFGLGRVESVTPRPAGSSARVRFDSVGLKTLILEYANLQRLD